MLLIKQVGQSQTDAKGLHPFGLDKKGAPICPNLQGVQDQNLPKEIGITKKLCTSDP